MIKFEEYERGIIILTNVILQHGQIREAGNTSYLSIK